MIFSRLLGRSTERSYCLVESGKFDTPSVLIQGSEGSIDGLAGVMVVDKGCRFCAAVVVRLYGAFYPSVLIKPHTIGKADGGGVLSHVVNRGGAAAFRIGYK